MVRPRSVDLGLHGESRAKLRTLCQSTIIESSVTVKRKYSYSALSSVLSVHDEKNAVSALRTLQKERLVVSRLGFVEKAMELDRQIEKMRAKAKRTRDQEEEKILDQRMRLLSASHR